MKTILVDAVYCLVNDQGEIFSEMKSLLETYSNRKIVLTGANDEQYKKYKLDEVGYEVFSLKHDPEKTDPQYYQTLLSRFHLKPSEVLYFEHNPEAVKSAQSVGITSHYYDNGQKDLTELKKFIDSNL